MAKQYTDLVPEPGLQDKNIWILAALASGNLPNGTTSSGLALVIGSPSDPAWNGSDPEATVISLLKGIYNKLP